MYNLRILLLMAVLIIAYGMVGNAFASHTTLPEPMATDMPEIIGAINAGSHVDFACDSCDSGLNYHPMNLLITIPTMRTPQEIVGLQLSVAGATQLDNTPDNRGFTGRYGMKIFTLYAADETTIGIHSLIWRSEMDGDDRPFELRVLPALPKSEPVTQTVPARKSSDDSDDFVIYAGAAIAGTLLYNRYLGDAPVQFNVTPTSNKSYEMGLKYSPKPNVFLAGKYQNDINGNAKSVLQLKFNF